MTERDIYYFKFSIAKNRVVALKRTKKYTVLVKEPEGPELFQYGLQLIQVQPVSDHTLLEIAKINGYLTGDFTDYKKVLKEKVLLEVDYDWEKGNG